MNDPILDTDNLESLLDKVDVKKNQVHLDANAGIPMCKAAITAMQKVVCLPNPSNNLTQFGKLSEACFNRASDSIVRQLTGGKGTHISTSGATESIVTILRSVYAIVNGDVNNMGGTSRTRDAEEKGAKKKKRRVFPILVTDGEHPAIGACCEQYGISIVKCAATSEAVRMSTLHTSYCALFVTHVVSLSGKICPLEKICEAFRDKCSYAPVVVDATQSVGKIDDLPKLLSSADVIIYSSHKFGGPKGAGGVVIREGREDIWQALIPGSQQNGKRGGTLSVPSVVCTAIAMKDAYEDIGKKLSVTRNNTRAIVKAIKKARMPRIIVLSPPDDGSEDEWTWNTVLLSIPVCSKAIASRLSEKGFNVGVGTACQTNVVAHAPKNTHSDANSGGNKQYSVGEEHEVPTTHFQIRISLTPGQSIDEDSFVSKLKESYMEVLEKLYTNLGRLMNGDNHEGKKTTMGGSSGYTSNISMEDSIMALISHMRNHAYDASEDGAGINDGPLD